MTASLIPLYAVGVFLAFALSQAGMVVHWWRLRDRHWRKSLFFNATGALLSAVVFLTAGITKFTEGAWVAVLAVGLFLVVTMRIRRHYESVGKALRLHPHAIELPTPTIPAHPSRGAAQSPATTSQLPEALPDARTEEEALPDSRTEEDARTEEEDEETPEEIRHLSVVPIATMDLAGMRALAYAASLHQPVLALHVSPEEYEAERFREYWTLWGDHLPLEVVVSPYRAIVAPLVHYIEALHAKRPDLTLTVILPEIVTMRWRYRLLHSRIAPRLRHALRPLPKIVITTVPFHV